MDNRRLGFTLIELSIVLVIIALIAGAILAGRELLHTAALRSQITQIQNYDTAVNAFIMKFRALPGDMPNATSFWPARSPANCTYNVPDSTATCNGNGDGYLNGINSVERILFWQQMGLAGMVPGSYTGNVDGSALVHDFKVGQTGPGTKLYPNVVMLVGTFRGWPYNFNQIAMWPSLGFQLFGYADQGITPIDLYYIDSKMDDGAPGTGKVFAGHKSTGPAEVNLNANCINFTGPSYYDGNTPYENVVGATYNITSTLEQCVLTVKPSFSP